jgi:hypothetical protein
MLSCLSAWMPFKISRVQGPVLLVLRLRSAGPSLERLLRSEEAMMNKELSIQQVAERTGLGIHTLRYNER